MDKRFDIIATDNVPAANPKKAAGTSRRQEIQARFDRLWLIDSEQFNPLRNAQGRQSLDRAFELVQSKLDLNGKRTVDLGCGYGAFCRRLRDAGAVVDAVDISANALKHLQGSENNGITAIQDYIPFTSLNDNTYDLVVSMDIIGDLAPKEHRLYFSEMARLVKSDGYVLCATSLDIGTEGALQAFGALAETEFNILKWKFSYNALAIHIGNFLKAPERFAKAKSDPNFRKQQLEKRRNISKAWFRLNSSIILGTIWQGIAFISRPIAKSFENNTWLLNTLEKVCRPLWDESGISHIIFIGQRRPIVPPTKEELQAYSPKQKRQVWE
jgi:2-polyprenyl-3-methyl-5-hydroxy-6-metoxy-1,4-benzoquinol methylase